MLLRSWVNSQLVDGARETLQPCLSLTGNIPHCLSLRTCVAALGAQRSHACAPPGVPPRVNSTTHHGMTRHDNEHAAVVGVCRGRDALPSVCLPVPAVDDGSLIKQPRLHCPCVAHQTCGATIRSQYCGLVLPTLFGRHLLVGAPRVDTRQPMSDCSLCGGGSPIAASAVCHPCNELVIRLTSPPSPAQHEAFQPGVSGRGLQVPQQRGQRVQQRRHQQRVRVLG